MRINPILRTDSYKQSHFLQYPPNTTNITSYIEARGLDLRLFDSNAEVVFFGLQAFLKEYMLDPITKADIDEAEAFVKQNGEPFNRQGWDYIVNQHGGNLPLFIAALPEGTVTLPGVPLVQVCNSDTNVPWLTSFVETELLRGVWYPTTVASLSREVKKVIAKYLRETADNLSGLPFKLNDFGARGVSSSESSMLGGMAHLVNFMGGDTLEGAYAARRYYGADMAAYSIPASEHSTITSWGKDNEVLAFKNMLTQFGGPGKLVACVSDSYDLYNACNNLWGTELKQQILDMGGTLVVRPDSGDPVQVTLDVVEILGEKFGYTFNNHGYKVLNPAIRIIQGDGVNITSIGHILENYKSHGWSADNIAFGMGGGLLQQVNRDTLKFAMKANQINFADGTHAPVFKDPVTDPGKASKKGAQVVLKSEQGFLYAKPFDEVDPITRVFNNKLEVIYVDGQLVNEQTFDDIRKRAEI